MNNFVREDASVIQESVARGGFGGNESIAWTSAVSHMGHTSNVFKVTIKLQTFLFQMIFVKICLSQWRRGLRRRSTAARLLRSGVRIPPGH
jgi:hypothetical protein